jgi:hypothetical protein
VGISRLRGIRCPHRCLPALHLQRIRDRRTSKVRRPTSQEMTRVRYGTSAVLFRDEPTQNIPHGVRRPAADRTTARSISRPGSLPSWPCRLWLLQPSSAASGQNNGVTHTARKRASEDRELDSAGVVQARASSARAVLERQGPLKVWQDQQALPPTPMKRWRQPNVRRSARNPRRSIAPQLAVRGARDGASLAALAYASLARLPESKSTRPSGRRNRSCRPLLCAHDFALCLRGGRHRQSRSDCCRERNLNPSPHRICLSLATLMRPPALDGGDRADLSGTVLTLVSPTLQMP